MNKYAYMIAAAFALALAAGSAQAGGSWGSVGGGDGFDNGIQLNGIPGDSVYVEAAELRDGLVLTAENGGLNVPISGVATEIVRLPDGPVLAGAKVGGGSD